MLVKLELKVDWGGRKAGQPVEVDEQRAAELLRRHVARRPKVERKRRTTGKERS